MRLDEFAFFNEQLASMLRDNLPLEGSMRELSATMGRGKLRDQLQALEGDLVQGMDLAEAARKRKFPDLYVSMLAIGQNSEQLPHVLSKVADHYRRAHLLGMRLRGMMTYPTLVMIFLAVFSVLYMAFLWPIMYAEVSVLLEGSDWANSLVWQWLTPGLMLSAAAIWTIVLLCKPLRRWLSWRISPFREANLARFADMCSTLLQTGMDVPATFAFVLKLEGKTPLAKDLRAMQAASEGGVSLSQLVATCVVLPPVFRWLLTIHEDNPALAFRHAADYYRNRSEMRAEILLYVAMPVSIVLVAFLVFLQFCLLWAPLVILLDSLGGG